MTAVRMSTGAATEIGSQLLERYGRAGYDVDQAHLTPTRFGWLFEADLYAGGTRHRVTATGRALEVTSETIDPADTDPFDAQVTRLQGDRP